MGRRSGRRRRERRRGSERREGQAAVDWVRVVWVAFPSLLALSLSLDATTSAESRKEDPGCTARALPCTHASPRPLDPLARSVYSSLYSNDAILRSTSSADERPSSETCFSTPRSVGVGEEGGQRVGRARAVGRARRCVVVVLLAAVVVVQQRTGSLVSLLIARPPADLVPPRALPSPPLVPAPPRETAKRERERDAPKRTKPRAGVPCASRMRMGRSGLACLTAG